MEKPSYSFNVILLSNKERKSADTCSNIDKSQKHPELQQPSLHEGIHTLYFSLGEGLGGAELIYDCCLGGGKE